MHKYNPVCRFVRVWNLSLTLREESITRVFENRALRRIFGPKRDELIGGGGSWKMRS
jgi:PAS domain-containing protein